MTELKSAISPDNTLLVATEVKNAEDVTTATNSNSDNIAKGRGSVSDNDTHVGFLGEKIVAGAGIAVAETNDGADETLTISGFIPPILGRVDDDTLVVGTGPNDAQTIIELATAGNWIGGASLESADELVHVYEVLAAPGTYKLSDKQPQYTAPVESNRQADMQVNNVAFDGTAGQGLNATTVIYNNGTDGDDVVAGMFALLYDDASFTLGRGRGTGAGTALGNLSVALITATTAGAAAGTLTLEAGHQIAINDDDYIIIVDAGELLYRFDGSAWYRHIGALFNDSGSNLLDLTAQYGSHQKYGSDSYLSNEGADYTTANTSFEDVDSSDFTLELTTLGGDVMIGFVGTIQNNNLGSSIYLDVKIDGALVAGDDGMIFNKQAVGSSGNPAAFTHLKSGLVPGSHIFKLQWKVDANTATMHAGAGTGQRDVHPQFWVKEIR